MLEDAKFEDVLDRVPMYLSHDADRFKALFHETVGAGDGMPIVARALSGKPGQMRNLLAQTAAMVRGAHSLTELVRLVS